MALFGLLSDLDGDKWKDGGDPGDTKAKKTMAGGTYQPWGIVKVCEEAHCLRYFLNSNSGNPNQGLLYGAHRNLLKSVGHCWMTFVEKEPGNIITGIAIEDDWVVIKQEYLDTFKAAVPHDEKHEATLTRSETIDMGIYGDLVHKKWDRKGKPPRGKGQLGYHFMEVLKTCEVKGEEHCFEIGLGNDDGHSSTAKITEAQRNPFHAITKGYFKIEGGIIKGVMVEDDWVEMCQE